MPARAIDPDLTEHLTATLSREGYIVDRVERFLPPLDTGGDVEVLFIGRKGENSDPALYTYRVADRHGAEAQITAGW